MNITNIPNLLLPEDIPSPSRVKLLAIKLLFGDLVYSTGMTFPLNVIGPEAAPPSVEI